ncbi:MAG TPA: helix-turn-helix domain-containing protein [Hymenobacter sp.]
MMPSLPITSDADYNALLAEFDRLADDPAAHHDRLIELRDAIDAYEVAQGHEPPLPKTLAGRLELEMFKLRMKQKQFALLLGITETRLSEVMRGRRQPNLDLIKRLHTRLHISGDELLGLE